MKQKDGGGREVVETRDSMLLQSMKKRERERERERERREIETECLGERGDLIQLTKGSNHSILYP